MTAARGFASFGQRAEMERQGILPDRDPDLVEKPEPRKNTVEILVTPVIDRDALVAVTDQISAQITAAVKAAFQQGITEGIAEAEYIMDSHGE